ncbi:unnamed protein product [Cercospora beticola]|nr:unnamed protein product [Cercospora beticola]
MKADVNAHSDGEVGQECSEGLVVAVRVGDDLDDGVYRGEEAAITLRQTPSAGCVSGVGQVAESNGRDHVCDEGVRDKRGSDGVSVEGMGITDGSWNLLSVDDGQARRLVLEVDVDEVIYGMKREQQRFHVVEFALGTKVSTLHMVS